MKITKYFDLFVGKNGVEQLNVMEKLLDKNGFKLSVVENRGCITYFYSKSGVDNIFAYTCTRNGVGLPVIIPTGFAEKHYMNEGIFNKVIRLNSHSYDNAEITPVLDHNGKKNVKLHRVLLEEMGIDIKDKEVDHISCNQGVNVPEELRPCTSKQNKANKKDTKSIEDSSFAYDEFHDFKNSIWIPFLHYVLGAVSDEGMRTLREMELIVA